MSTKTLDILQQYDKELQHVQHLFAEHHESPPLCKNQPPLAGAINWSHSLFLRIRKTMAKFQAMDELTNTDEGREVSKRFVVVSKEIRAYETRLFEEWKENVNAKERPPPPPPPPPPRPPPATAARRARRARHARAERCGLGLARKREEVAGGGAGGGGWRRAGGGQ